MSFIVAIDFDGVLHSYTSKWIASGVIPDPPVEGAIAWLNGLAQEKDLKLVIHTTRARMFDGQVAVKRWLLEQGFTGNLLTLEVTDRKVGAHLYIDDRGYCFTGRNFPSAEAIRRFQRWGNGPQPPLPCLCRHDRGLHSTEPDTSLCLMLRCDCERFEPFEAQRG